MSNPHTFETILQVPPGPAITSLDVSAEPAFSFFGEQLTDSGTCVYIPILNLYTFGDASLCHSAQIYGGLGER